MNLLPAKLELSRDPIETLFSSSSCKTFYSQLFPSRSRLSKSNVLSFLWTLEHKWCVLHQLLFFSKCEDALFQWASYVSLLEQISISLRTQISAESTVQEEVLYKKGLVQEKLFLFLILIHLQECISWTDELFFFNLFLQPFLNLDSLPSYSIWSPWWWWHSNQRRPLLEIVITFADYSWNNVY